LSGLERRTSRPAASIVVNSFFATVDIIAGTSPHFLLPGRDPRTSGRGG
jgi:hypothetical protein